MDPLLFLLIGIVWIISAAAGTVWNFVTSRKRVDRWARENDFTLLRCEWHIFSDAPFRGFWGHRKGGWQVIWAISVAGPDKASREGWILCGHPLVGMLSDAIEVAWAKTGQSAFR